MKNTKLYILKNQEREDGKIYNQLFLETKDNVYIILEWTCKKC